MTIFGAILGLAEYGINKGLIEKEDEDYIINGLLSLFGLDSYEKPIENIDCELDEILGFMCDYAVKANIIPDNGVVSCDLFDAAIMGLLTPRPSDVIAQFYSLWQKNPQKATDYFYNLCKDNNYIRTTRVAKDKKWVTPTEYGNLDITINLSKPEKDPRQIAAEKKAPQSGYPKCLLCMENEGYAGRINHPARQNLRIIPMVIDGKRWGLQYSPYVYYNEHCIALNAHHIPMKIDRSTFVKLTDFISILPHYFIGSNADLPIVGGSILSHDHFQGGRYSFAMEKAPIEINLKFKGFEDVKARIVKWPMSVIRVSCTDKDRLIDLCDRILTGWRDYTDRENYVFAQTPQGLHNTITPIARRKGELYEIDLVLRNNITTSEHPLGLYHPHADKHHIKKENIGLIEVMGLAVLPSRLLKECEILADCILNGKDIHTDERVASHADWVDGFLEKYDSITEENIEEILRQEIGLVFLQVLEDAGVYKCTPEGREAFLKFIDYVNM
ncbi:MAG: galactose-1-phosphate uridylyltransferase [Clostridiales bacterium GWF2_36_10]|nr:MAG: galactose-1-phosphate uridylyltransferase [Clostridiales bacterium GWF2_36_10]HAN21344.1 galactose-1-phosphate uridylyltransferase [Clostridiales bacterium]